MSLITNHDDALLTSTAINHTYRTFRKKIINVTKFKNLTIDKM